VEDCISVGNQNWRGRECPQQGALGLSPVLPKARRHAVAGTRACRTFLADGRVPEER